MNNSYSQWSNNSRNNNIVGQPRKNISSCMNATSPFQNFNNLTNTSFNNNVFNTDNKQHTMRNNSFNDLYTQLVDPTNNNPSYPSNDELMTSNDLMHMTQHQFSQQQQLNRLLQRRQRSTFSKSQVIIFISLFYQKLYNCSFLCLNQYQASKKLMKTSFLF